MQSLGIMMSMCWKTHWAWFVSWNLRLCLCCQIRIDRRCSLVPINQHWWQHDSLTWFMARHTSIHPKLQPKYLKLARFVLKNIYVEWKGIERTFLQKVGTAMGTSFSVTYTIVYFWFGWKCPLSMNFSNTLYSSRGMLTTFCWSGQAQLQNYADSEQSLEHWQQTSISSWNGKAHHQQQMQKFQLNSTSVSIAGSFSSILKSLACMDHQCSSSGYIGNPVAPTRICFTDPTTHSTFFKDGSRPKYSDCSRTSATLLCG